MMIDTRSVDEEIVINCDDSLARTVHSKLGNEVALTPDRVGTRALVLILIPGFTVLASTLASGSWAITAGAWVGAVGDVVIAGLEAVRRALLSHNTGVDPVVEGRRGAATIATTSARAGKHILRGKDDIMTLLDAVTIAQRADSTESPAGTAPGLITDHRHRLAVGIIITRIIRLRSTKTLIRSVGNTLKTSMEGLRISNTKKLCTNILKAHARNRASQRSTP